MTNQTNLLQSLGWAVLNSLWQLALLWVLYQFITAIFKSARPAAKSLLATSLLMMGFGWFVYTFFSALGAANSGTASSVFMLNENSSINNLVQQLLPTTSVLYLCLLVFPIFRFIRNYRYVQVIRNHGLSKAAPEWRLFVRDMSARMGIRKPVHIWISEWVTSPVTIGYLKPVILVPLAAVNKLNTQQMEAVLLHELSHIRRYDYLLNFICNIIRTILYFNPFAKAFIKITEAEREKSCDELVLQFRYSSYDYASALLTLEKLSREQKLLMLSAAGNGKDLYQRIETIMGVQQKRRVTILRTVPVLAAIGCILIMNVMLYTGAVLNGNAAWTNQSGKYAAPLASVQPVAWNEEIPVTVFNNSDEQDRIPLAENTEEIKENNTWRSSVIPVNFKEEVPVIALDKEDEAIVKEAVASSRKVLEKAQWKEMEKSLADVFTAKEKAALQSMLKNEMNKFDWKQWEDKLRQSFDQVNWEKVNSQLNEAVYQFKADSLVKVYSEAVANLQIAQNELKALAVSSIPDTDISVKALAEKQKAIQREVEKLKSTRQKKIVHL